jgi:PadR family transcriptional regulator
VAQRSTELLQGTLDMMILKALAWGPKHGFGVGRWIEQVTEGRLLIEEGALYPALHRMERRGWLAASWGVSDNNRRAKYYTLTPDGRRALKQAMSTWQDASAAVAQVLEADG